MRTISSQLDPDKKTIIISAGGTGGHIFPALAVAHELARQYNILWVGAKVGLENKLVPEHDYPLVTINISGVRKNGWLKKLLLPITLINSHIQCLKIIYKYKPSIIVGFGGYATFPIGITARVLGKPLIIHEQNSVAGLSNRVLAKVASRVLCAFPGVLISSKTRVVGNPVREEIISLKKIEPRDINSKKLRILILGGSLGARALNENVPLALAKVKDRVLHVIHQVGRGDADLVQACYDDNGINDAKVVNFIADMADAYANADLIICRSGASTVAEISCAGVATIFVPYPYAVDDHQTTNAKYLVDNKAAILLPEKTLTPQSLADLITTLSPKECSVMGCKSRELAIYDSTQEISREVISFCS